MNTTIQNAARLSPVPWIVIVAAGIAAAVNIWKVPPLLPQIGETYGISLVDAGVLLGIVQLAGVISGTAVGLVAETIGFRRCVLIGLATLAVASTVGAFATSFDLLLGMRAVESAGLLLVLVAGPGVIRRTVHPHQLDLPSGVWASYQGVAAFAALGVAAAFAATVTVTSAWLVVAVVTAAAAAAVLLFVPADPKGEPGRMRGVGASVWRTVRRWKLWVGGIMFFVYAAAWMAVLGFLPVILGDAGVEQALANLLTGIASFVNAIGAVVAGLLLRRGASARLLMVIGAVVPAAASLLVVSDGFTPAVRFVAVLVFSTVGGLIPGTLTRLALEYTPVGGSTPTSIGLMVQWSNGGLLAGPPIAAAIVTATGSWAATAWLTVGAAVIAAVLAVFLRPERTLEA